MYECRLFDDVIHLFAFAVLISNIWIYKSAAGVSTKTQVLLALVFSTRYFDLITEYNSVYDGVMKLLLICISYHSMYMVFKMTCESDLDTFRYEFLIVISMILALIGSTDLTRLQVLWTFSEYLEAVATWPQYFMIKKTKKVTDVVFVYLTGLGLFRMLSVAYHLYVCRQWQYNLIFVVSGVVQILSFVVFCVACVTNVVEITSMRKSWLAKNLTQNNQIGVFNIQSHRFIQRMSEVEKQLLKVDM